jgi:hypothetical protein
MSRFIVVGAFLLAAHWSGAQTSASTVASQESNSAELNLSYDPTGHLPLAINVTGTLRGGTSPAAVVQVTFAIFKEQEGGSPLWSEEQTVELDGGGRYVAVLGGAHPDGLPIDIFLSGAARWLEVFSDGYSQEPRTALVSVPYALKSSDADTLSGRPASAFVLAEEVPSLIENVLAAPAVRSAGVGGADALDASVNASGLELQPGPQFRVESPNRFLNRKFFYGGLTLPYPRKATDNSADGVPSSSIDLMASAFNSATALAEREHFRLQAEAVGSNSARPAGRLNLLFGTGRAAPRATGFSINSDGTMTFAPKQAVPLSAIQEALDDAGLSSSGGGTGGSSTAPVVDTGNYSWQQTPKDKTGLQVGANSVTLAPCPRGVNGTDAWHFLYIAGTGTPEAVLITGGTCVSRASTGTIEFMAAYTHPATYRIESATGGVQEALNDAITPKSDGQTSRSVLVTPGDYLFHARLSIRASSVNISVSGATITCAMKDTCIMLGDPSNSNTFQAITLDGLRVRPGVPGGTWPAVEDNAEGSGISNMGTASNPLQVNSFGHLIQVDNDQAAHIDRLTVTLGAWGKCDSTFCSSAIYGVGNPAVNAGVIWINNSNISLQCGGNGIDNDNGNTLHVTDSVVQGYAQFGIRSYGRFGVNPSVQLTNVYEEVGNCTNPVGTGIAGLIVGGGFAEVSGGVGPVGKLPIYATRGTVQYNYYVVVRSSTMGVSVPFLAGSALTDGTGMIPVLWNRVGNSGVVTYDILRTTGGTGWDLPAPYGTGNFSVAVGISTDTCSNNVCSFSDNAGSGPSTYTVAGVTYYSPALRNWPGPIILTQKFDTQNSGGLVPTRLYAQTIGANGIINSAGATEPSVFAQECDPQGNWSPIWMQCLGGSSLSNDYQVVTATVLQNSANGGSKGGLKGRLIFEAPADSSIAGTHIITLADSNPRKTMATPNNRPTWDSADAYIGYDQPDNVNPWETRLSFGAPVSISSYIQNVGDGVSWIERLTGNLKAFKVPVSAPRYQTAANCLSAAGICGSAGAGIVAISPGATTVSVSDTAVTATSEIHLDENLSYGTAMGVSCDTSFGRQYRIAAQTPGTGFVIETNIAPASAACLTFALVN